MAAAVRRSSCREIDDRGLPAIDYSVVMVMEEWAIAMSDIALKLPSTMRAWRHGANPILVCIACCTCT